MFFTVADARPVVAPFVRGGACADSTEVLERINDCVRRLLVKANWAYTVRWLRICTTNNTITLPRGVQRIVGDPVIDGVPRRLFSPGYEFLENGPGEVCAGGNGLGKDLIDMREGWPTFFDIPGDATYYLAAFSTAEADATKTLSLAGRDQYGADITTNGFTMPTLAINHWPTEGTINTALYDVAKSSVPYKELLAVHKPVTAGHVNLYTFDADTGRMFFLSKYTPRETKPSYRRYRITTPDFVNGSSVMLQVKLGYEPAEQDTDVLLVQNLDAIKAMAQAIQFENASELNAAQGYEATAERLLTEQAHDVSEQKLNIQITEVSARGRGGQVGWVI